MHGRLALLVAVAGLASCGGSDPPPPDDALPVRYYYSFAFEGSPLLLLLSFQGGLLYGTYLSDYRSGPFPQFAYAGMLRAGLPENGDPAGRIGTLIDFDGMAERVAVVSGITIDDSTFVADLTVDGRTRRIDAYRPEGDALQNDLAKLPGAYRMQMRSAAGSALDVVTHIDESRALRTTTGSTCSVTGSFESLQLGNLYAVTAEVSSGCAIPEGRYAGHGFQAFGPLRNIYVFLRGSKGGAMLLLSERT